MRFIENMLTIRRVEFLIAEIPIFVIPLLVASRGASLDRTAVGLGIGVFLLLFNFGDMTNCLADRELDAVYKPHLSRAVRELGPRFVAVQIGITAIAAFALTAFLAARTGHWLLIPLVLIGLFLGAGYSLEPIRFKGRGVLQLVCLWLIIFVGPMLFMTTVVTAFPGALPLALSSAYATIQMGIVLVNTAEDHPEDRGANIRTIIVALGLPRGMALARVMVIAGGCALILVLALLGARWSLLPLVVAILAASRSLGRLLAELSITALRRTSRWVPLWLTSVAWTTLFAVWSST